MSRPETLDTVGTEQDRDQVAEALREGLAQDDSAERAMTALREFRRLLPARR